MSVIYYVALPFVRTEDGVAPGEAKECQSEPEANRRARSNVARPCECWRALIQAHRRPELGQFSDATILRTFGEVPNNLVEL
jgi:hypothetical protein